MTLYVNMLTIFMCKCRLGLLENDKIKANFHDYFRKGDYDKSIGQYIKTIGYLEPSYIIRKVNWKILNLD
jgi:hypothetical protein